MISSLVYAETPQTSVTSLPPGFVRLRYFFGKRLGVADFLDEQTYHGAKDRFHNTQLHGAGIVCGLAVKPFYGPDMASQPPSTSAASDSESSALTVHDTTLLRVGRGAALDELGREIVVGYDQCIDTSAWFQVQQKSQGPGWPFPADLDSAGRLVTYVVLSYKECQTDPEPAPRDACNVTAGGAEFGRVREEFCLDLVTRSQVAALSPALAPSSASVDGALGASSARAAWQALVQGVTAPESVNRVNRGLVIGKVLLCLTPSTSAAQSATALALDGLFVPPVLFSSSLLQELLRRVFAVDSPEELQQAGPAITGASWTLAGGSSGSTSGGESQLTVTLSLDGPVLGASVETDQFRLWGLDARKWELLGQPDGVHYDPAAGTLQATWRVSAGGTFSLRLPDDAPPIISAQLLPLRPRGYSYVFSAESSS